MSYTTVALPIMLALSIVRLEPDRDFKVVGGLEAVAKIYPGEVNEQEIHTKRPEGSTGAFSPAQWRLTHAAVTSYAAASSNSI